MNKIKESIKGFDAVQFMRDQRDRLSKELYGLSTEVIIEYLKTSQSKERVKPRA